MKTSTNNFYALQANADKVAEFYEEQTHKINAAVETKPTPATSPTTEPGGSSQPTTPQPKPRVRKIVHLNTHCSTPIHTEADIDTYLQTLKEQLMQYISNDNDIIIS